MAFRIGRIGVDPLGADHCRMRLSTGSERCREEERRDEFHQGDRGWDFRAEEIGDGSFHDLNIALSSRMIAVWARWDSVEITVLGTPDSNPRASMPTEILSGKV